jgi:hypothetical protein
MKNIAEPAAERPQRVELSDQEKKLVTAKMAALQAYRDAQARLTEANLKLLEAGIRPELGSMCW